MAVEIPSPLAAQPQGAGEGVAAAISSHPCCRQKPCLPWRCVPGAIGLLPLPRSPETGPGQRARCGGPGEGRRPEGWPPLTARCAPQR